MPGDRAREGDAGKMTEGTAGYACHFLHLLYLACVLPFFYVSVLDLMAECAAALNGESTDPAQHFAMALQVWWVAWRAFGCFLLAAAVSVYVFWVESRKQRGRIAFWYGAAFVIVVLGICGPNSPQFPARVYYSLYQTALSLPLLVPPVVWMWRDWRGGAKKKRERS